MITRSDPPNRASGIQEGAGEPPERTEGHRLPNRPKALEGRQRGSYPPCRAPNARTRSTIPVADERRNAMGAATVALTARLAYARH